MKIRIEEITRRVEEHKTRSAWDRGVKDYALDLLGNLECYTGCGEIDTDEIRITMLNGAKNWKAYSWGGCSLIYDTDIAKALCTPSELKKTKGGERRPNSKEEWLDVQARALYQAAGLIMRTAAKIK